LQPEFDVIVVGAGPAGSSAAVVLARKGVKVLLLERAMAPGASNMTGGVLYGDFRGSFGLINLIPDFEATAPLQRRIISHELVILGRPDSTRGTSRYLRISKNSLVSRLGLIPMTFETGHDYSLLRLPFDRWLAERAVEAGATLSTRTTVEGLLSEGGAIVGVRTTKEEIRSRLVVDASGVTSKLVSEAGLRGNLVPRQLYHGIKRVYRLEKQKIEERLRVQDGDGRALFFTGGFMHGMAGQAFLHTGADTLSVGVLVPMESLIRTTTEHFDQAGKLLDVQDELEAHPFVSELLKGGELVEYSAHNLPRGYRCILRRPYADGFVAAGDALGAVVKLGPMVDGMTGAIASGMMAATVYLEARASGSFSRRNLSRYRDLLTPIYEDVNRSGRDSFISENSLFYDGLPKLIFGTRIFAKTHRFTPSSLSPVERDAVQRVEEGTRILQHDQDRYEHIEVNASLASSSITKPWVPICPVNCFTMVTNKGVFASFRDLYQHNLSLLSAKGANPRHLKRKAMAQTMEDIARAELRFDHFDCLSCGACGAIGPPEMVLFRHQRDGHGVRYAFG